MSQFDKLYTSREKLVKTVMDLTENVNRISGEVDTKQDTLVSGESIKTVNGESLLGSGGLAISGETLVVDETPTPGSDNLVKSGGVAALNVRTQPILQIAGYIAGDGEVINQVKGKWTHSDYILIDDILGDAIVLSKGASSNTPNPVAIAGATYDESYQPVDLLSDSGTTFSKSLFSNTAKYIAFSFYDKTNVVISNYAVRDQILYTKSLIEGNGQRIGNIETFDDTLKPLGITLIKGYIDGQGVIQNTSYGAWRHSGYIDLDSFLDKHILLSQGTSGNPSSPAVSPAACYDANHQVISYITGEGANEYSFPSNAKYAAFSFYNKSDVSITSNSIIEKTKYLNKKIDDRAQEIYDVIEPKALSLVKGYVEKDTGDIVNSTSGTWYHTQPILIDSCIGDSIELSIGSNSNTQNPAVAGYATYDENMQPVTVYNLGSTEHVNKSAFGEGSVYIVFSYYLPTLVNVYINNASINGCLEIAFDDISSLKTRVSALEIGDIFSRNINKDAAVRGVGTKAVNTDIKPLSLIHVSDIHTKSNNYKCFANACEFYEHYNIIDAMIVTGDIVWDNFEDLTTWYNEALTKTTKPVLNVIGNHDAGQNGNPTSLDKVSTDKQCYDRFIAPYVSDWGVTQPTDAATNGNSYYYKDFSTEKVRLIVLNEFETEYEIDPNDPTKLLYSREYRAMRQAQVTWLINTLTNTPSDYGVIVALHQPLGLLKSEDNAFVSFPCVDNNAYFNVYSSDKEWLAKIIEAYRSKSTLTLSVTQTGAVVQNDATLDCDCDFTAVTSELICVMCGHTHMDYIGHLKNYPNIPILCVGADNLLYTSGFQPRAEGTPSEDLFNVVNIDRNRKTIKIIRIGSDASVVGQVRDQMIMSYATT